MAGYHNSRNAPKVSGMLWDAVKTAFLVIGVLAVLVLARVTWEVWQYGSEPAACQQWGGSWSFLDGWSCETSPFGLQLPLDVGDAGLMAGQRIA